MQMDAAFQQYCQNSNIAFNMTQNIEELSCFRLSKRCTCSGSL